MLSFIAALYNEEEELEDLIGHVTPYVDGLYFADDESIDNTKNILGNQIDKWVVSDKAFGVSWLAHTGLPETVKNTALQMVPDGSWVLLLDADERFAPGVLDDIRDYLTPPAGRGYPYGPNSNVTHVYFQQLEIIDGRHVRTFQKSKLFKKEAIRFSTGIHEDDQFTGEGLYKPEWVVYHRKTTAKQVQREQEYLATYDKLLEEGKIDEGRRQWLRGLHHYVK